MLPPSSTGSYPERINNIVLRFGHTFGAEHSVRPTEGEGILLTELLDGSQPPVSGICPDGLPASIRPLLSTLLQEHQITTSQHLAEAYAGGTLAATQGLGDTSLRTIPQWQNHRPTLERQPRPR